jgi:hypothetical protein
LASAGTITATALPEGHRRKDAGKKKSISLVRVFERHTLGDFELNSKNTPLSPFITGLSKMNTVEKQCVVHVCSELRLWIVGRA